MIQDISEKEKNTYNTVVSHPLQSFEWGEFRKKLGTEVIRKGFFEKDTLTGGFQLTIHPIPHTPFTIGYLPKGEMPDGTLLHELQKIGKANKSIFIQLEPNVEKSQISNNKSQTNYNTQRANNSNIDDLNLFGTWNLDLGNLRRAAHPLFTKYTFVLDLTKSEDELIKNMHHKTRYNIKVAKKHGVEIVEDNSENAFEEYIRLTHETTKRQKFYAHSEKYHRVQWQTLPHEYKKNQLSSHLFLAKHKENILATWIVFVFKDMLYYPYGASSTLHRETMASNLMMWEIIRFGKKLGLKRFDMWGALGPNPDTKDPWYGFHRFKEGYGATLTTFVGSFDLVINPFIYPAYILSDKIRWMLLKLQRKL